ncbi:glutathione S-transferase [Roseovarius faecimaris]|uniref:Glutathione S-transferase n=1 Tax=Roseovarius faecimaris TaxID=2494550 RepID=A0A6I6IKC1_9RHOB|nr:glutathione S-transferase [Roseovarius faecimaris]QGX97299.1 glutathione S-transferase [Roseovarius faecimaris]
MQLISAGPSPFVRKVRVLLHETGQSEDVEVVEVAATPVATPPELAAANPVGKIPALIRPDGPALYDSRVITRYLDARADAGMYPQARLWETLTLEATADAIMEAGVLMVYEHRVRPEEKVFDGWVDAQWEKITRSVAAINARWMSHLAGPMDMSHIAVGCALGYLDFRHGARGWRKGNDALDDWYAVFAERESMKATAPE